MNRAGFLACPTNECGCSVCAGYFRLGSLVFAVVMLFFEHFSV
jgi:hypothetical protein